MNLTTETFGDVMVVHAPADRPTSILGGVAAVAAARSGLAGVIVDGAVRDVDQFRLCGLPLWTRSISPRAGKYRMEAVSVNVPIVCGGVQVVPGDLVIADDTGLCFVPAEIRDVVIARVLEVAGEEHRQVAQTQT
jgi:regulator of RNase E activity RraA